LKILAAHGGGNLASYAPRSDHAFFVAPANCDANIVLKKKPSEYLKHLYFDALVFKSNDEILSHHRGRNCPVHSSKIHRQCLRWVIRDWDETRTAPAHVGYAPESGSEIRVLASATMGLCGLMASPGA
jgi:hypothetical protein